MGRKKITIDIPNTGLIVEEPKYENYRATKLFGALSEGFVGTDSPLDEPPDIFPSGKGWLKVALDYGISEKQFNNNFDTFSCFPYDTEILMEDLSKKRISEIKVGEYVITHLGRKKKVTETMKKEIDEEVYSIKVCGLSKEIICTKEHPFLTDNGWVKAEDLKQGNLVCQLLLNNYSKDITSREVEKDKDFLWFLGMYLAEGNLGKERKCGDNNPKLKVNGSGKASGGIIFSLGKDEKHIADRIIKIGKELFNTTFTVYEYKYRPGGITVVGYNFYLKSLLKELGSEYCDKKELSTKMMLLEPDLQMEIFKGWMEGDGYTNINKKVMVGVSTSKKLVEQFHLILLRNKIKSSLYKRKEKTNRKDVWTLNVHSVEMNKIYPFGIVCEKSCRTKNEFCDNNYWYRKVEKIEKKKQVNGKQIKRVYNIEVEEDNSYIIDGNIVVHNCVIYTIAKATCYYLFKVYNVKITISEMYNAFYAEVVQNRGTTIEKGMESFRKHGWIADEKYPFTPDMTAEEFFREPPKSIQLEAEGVLTEWDFHWEVLPRTLPAIFEAYKKTPVVLIGFAWVSYYGEGVFFDDGNKANHAFLGLEPKSNGNNLIDDTYPRVRGDNDLVKDDMLKELHNSFKYGGAWRCWVTPKKDSLITKIFDMLKGLIWFHPDKGGDASVWMVKETADKGKMRKAIEVPAEMKSLWEAVFSTFDRNWGVKKVDYGELSQYKIVDNF